MDAPEIEKKEISILYEWLDQVSFSRKKRHIAHDFRDGKLAAETIHHFLPELVELHNYPDGFSAEECHYNWDTLNGRPVALLLRIFQLTVQWMFKRPKGKEMKESSQSVCEDGVSADSERHWGCGWETLFSNWKSAESDKNQTGGIFAAKRPKKLCQSLSKAACQQTGQFEDYWPQKQWTKFKKEPLDKEAFFEASDKLDERGNCES